MVSFSPATNSKTCNIQFCIADARARGWGSALKAICKTTDGTCPMQANACIKTDDISVSNLSNPMEVEGVSLLAEIPQAHQDTLQRTQSVYQEGENDKDNTTTSGSNGSVVYQEGENNEDNTTTSGSSDSVQ